MVDGAVLGMAINAMVGKTDLENSKNVANTEKTKKQIVQTLSAEEMEEMKSNKNFKVEGTKVIISETKGGLNDLKGVLLAQANSPKTMSDVGKNLIGQVDTSMDKISEDKITEIMEKFNKLKFQDKGTYILYKNVFQNGTLKKMSNADYEYAMKKYEQLIKKNSSFNEEEKIQILVSCFFYTTLQTNSAKKFIEGSDKVLVGDLTSYLSEYYAEIDALKQSLDYIEKTQNYIEKTQNYIEKTQNYIEKTKELQSQIKGLTDLLIKFLKGEGANLSKEEVLNKLDLLEESLKNNYGNDREVLDAFAIIKKMVLEKLGER